MATEDRECEKTGNVETEVTSCGNHSEWVFSVKDVMYNVAIKKNHLLANLCPSAETKCCD